MDLSIRCSYFHFNIGSCRIFESFHEITQGEIEFSQHGYFSISDTE